MSRHAPPPVHPTRPGFRQPARGFTIVEALMVMAVAAILIGLASPPMSQFLVNRRIEDVARRVLADLNLARSEAVKRNAPVLMCPGTSGTCAASPVAADWAGGWQICYDLNADDACDTSSANDPNPVRIGGAPTASATVSGPAARLRFNADGSLTASDLSAFRVEGAGKLKARSHAWTVGVAASGSASARRN